MRNRRLCAEGDAAGRRSATRIRIGSEIHHQWLDDYWPPVRGQHDDGAEHLSSTSTARRDRARHFGEWQRKWSTGWSTLLGVRNDMVWMNTGDGAALFGTGMMNMADAMAAMAFNAASAYAHRHQLECDRRWSRYDAGRPCGFELGYAHKSARRPTSMSAKPGAAAPCRAG